MSELRENQNVIVKYIMDCLKQAKEEKLSSEEFCDLVDEKFPVQESLRGYMPKFYIQKTTDMVISPEEDIDILDIVDYLASVYDEKVYKFDGTCMMTGDYTEEYRIWYCRDGFLVLRDSTIFWYPVNYDSASIQKDGMEIIETEDFRTPYFMLFPTRLTSYLLRMGKKGYQLLGDLDEYRCGDDHNNDLYKFQEK